MACDFKVCLAVLSYYNINVTANDGEEAILKAKQIWLKDDKDTRLRFSHAMIDNEKTRIDDMDLDQVIYFLKGDKSSINKSILKHLENYRKVLGKNDKP